MARSKFYREQITNACGMDVLQARHSDSVPGDFTTLIADLRVTVMGRKCSLTESPPVSSKRGVGGCLLTRLAWFVDCILGDAHEPSNENTVAVTFQKRMHCDNLIANSFPQFSLQMFVSASENRLEIFGQVLCPACRVGYPLYDWKRNWRNIAFGKVFSSQCCSHQNFKVTVCFLWFKDPFDGGTWHDDTQVKGRTYL